MRKQLAALMSRATDEWETPQAVFDALHEEFEFELDGAATEANSKVPEYCRYVSEKSNGLTANWGGLRVFLNPPYSKCRPFIAKAAKEAQRGATVVCLVPSRTDTRWFHEHVWNSDESAPRENVEVRFVKGRLKFCVNGKPILDKQGRPVGAPFPSVVIIFRPPA